jgi:ABC-type bacteriocin/lantibiotic exporter with double-glycine peptidase domain
MERYFEQHGFRTFGFRGEWKDLREQLEKGRPLIVALNTGHGNLHYVVVAGLDWQEGVVLTNDPAERKLLKQERSNFEKEWKAAGNWTLLAVPQRGERSSFQ